MKKWQQCGKALYDSSHKLPNGIEINIEDKRINIFPDHLKKIRQIMEYAQLDGIQIHENGLEMLVSLL